MTEQTITQMIKRPIVYDEERLWKTYHGWGKASSHPRLRAWAEENGMVNPNSGKVSQMGPWFAMWRYAFQNPKEAYPAWEEWMKENMAAIADKHVLINFDTFLKEIRKVARNMYSEKKVRAWCEKWKVKYE
jgi:hypothetical protein